MDLLFDASLTVLYCALFCSAKVCWGVGRGRCVCSSGQGLAAHMCSGAWLQLATYPNTNVPHVPASCCQILLPQPTSTLVAACCCQLRKRYFYSMFQ
jgi:hypothetical protein